MSTSAPAPFSASAPALRKEKDGFLLFLCPGDGMDTTRLGKDGLAFGDAEIDGERDGTAEVLTDVDGV